TDPHVVVQRRRRLADGKIPCRGPRNELVWSGDLVWQRGQPLQQRGNCAGEVVMTTRQANLDANDISDETVADNLGCLVKGGKRALPGAGLPDDAVPLNSFDDFLLLCDGTGEGFL